MAHRWRTKQPNEADKARRAKYRSPEHKAARAHWARLVEAGQATCRRCGQVLRPGSWHVGHHDVDTARLAGPECAGCNLKAAARKGNAIALAKRRAASTTGPNGTPRFVRATR